MTQQLARRGLYLSSQVATRVAAALLGVYAARVLGPRQLGLWAVFQIVYLYTAQAHLGTVNAMLREVPIARARHNESRAREIVEEAWGFVWVSSIVTGLTTASIVWLMFDRSEMNALLLSAACGLLAFFQLHSVFFNFYCFSYSELAKLAIAILVQQLVTTVGCVMFLKSYGVTGYLAAMAVGFSAMWIANLFGPLPRLRPRFSAREWRGLIVIGLPMLPGALMLYFGTSLDRIFVASRLGVTALGVFTVAAFFFQFGAALWDVAINTTYAKLASLYARANSDPERLGTLIADVLPGLLWLSSVVQGTLYIGAPLVIGVILPQYVSSIIAAQILVLAINLFGAGQFLTSTLTVIGRERISVAVRLFGLLVRVVSLLIALAASRSLAGIAAGILVGQLGYATLAFLVVRRFARVPLKSAAVALGAWGIGSGAAVLCSFVVRNSGHVAAALLYACLFLSITLLIERASGSVSKFWSFATA